MKAHSYTLSAEARKGSLEYARKALEQAQWNLGFGRFPRAYKAVNAALKAVQAEVNKPIKDIHLAA